MEYHTYESVILIALDGSESVGRCNLRFLFQHGVLKVKTTAEQQEERRREREVKAKKFKALTQKIFDKVKCLCLIYRP